MKYKTEVGMWTQRNDKDEVVGVRMYTMSNIALNLTPQQAINLARAILNAVTGFCSLTVDDIECEEPDV